MNGHRFYKGEWKAGEMDGQGTCWHTGGVEIGFFRCGMPSGDGVRLGVDPQTATLLKDGEKVRDIDLSEAIYIAGRMGFSRLPGIDA